MRDKLQSIVAREDTKEPFTDTQLCRQLAVSREYVTFLRKELGILDSRERKRVYICREIKRMFADEPRMAEAELLKRLKAAGYALSKYLLDKYLADMQNGGEPESALGEAPEWKEEESAFRDLVGADGSLDMQIRQAKATMLYPPRGLHCLILGETGVGKSELAEAMHRFAVASGVLPQEAPFLVFNCADYAENSQLLITQLFGCVKGAYTGAADKKGLIEQTDGGILFLDEVHRLSAEGQEMLFQLIDKDVYRRLGESDAIRTAKVQLIAATTENIETNLLATFKRRIPMLITVPPLMERPLTERLQLVRKFFGYESARMNAPLHVGADVVKAYLLYECKGNIGQLKSDIQVSCAKSFLSYVTKRERAVRVDIHDLTLPVKKGLMKLKSRRREVDSIVWKDFSFTPEQCARLDAEGGVYSFPRDFYSDIEKDYARCLEQGMDVREIKRQIGDEIEKKLQTVISHVKHHLMPLPLEEMAKVLGREIVDLVRQLIRIAEAELGELDASIGYCLAAHLNATFARYRQGKKIMNPNLEEIRRKFPREYRVAERIAAEIRRTKDMDLPEDEIGYITLYLRGGDQAEEAKIGVIVATHGGAGGCMLEVAAKLLNIEHGVSFEMRLEENPQDALARLTAIVENCDEGKGVLLLVDMGSLLTFGEIIQERTRIAVETIERVDTTMVIEALRRSILPGAALADILYGVENLNYTFPKLRRSAAANRPKAVIALCLTGEGAALHCRRQLKKIAGKALRDVAVLNMGVVGTRDIEAQLQETAQKYEIVGVVGSVDPKLPGVPYIPMDRLYSASGTAEALRLLGLSPRRGGAAAEKLRIPPVVQEMRFLRLDSGFDTKKKVLVHLCAVLRASGHVTEGFYAAVCEREKLGSYLVAQKVALPHADSGYVNRPAVLLAQAARPIPWDGANKTRLICLLALDIEGKDGVRFLYKKFQDQAVTDALEEASEEEEMRRRLLYGANCD